MMIMAFAFAVRRSLVCYCCRCNFRCCCYSTDYRTYTESWFESHRSQRFPAAVCSATVAPKDTHSANQEKITKNLFRSLPYPDLIAPTTTGSCVSENVGYCYCMFLATVLQQKFTIHTFSYQLGFVGTVEFQFNNHQHPQANQPTSTHIRFIHPSHPIHHVSFQPWITRPCDNLIVGSH